MQTLIESLLIRVREENPLIINITNQVTMNFVANGLLSIGASPVMTFAPEEAKDLMKLAKGVVINIGTLTPNFIQLAETYCSEAEKAGIPLTLDPVGAGASTFRTETCYHLLDRFKFKLIKGNASEIMALAGEGQTTKGVDSSIATAFAMESGQSLATKYGCIVLISGKTDVLVTPSTLKLFHGGSELMPKLTGSGCLLSALISAFISVHDNPPEAVSAGIVFYNQCAEFAAKKAQGPGSFFIHFIDALANPGDIHG